MLDVVVEAAKSDLGGACVVSTLRNRFLDGIEVEVYEKLMGCGYQNEEKKDRRVQEQRKNRKSGDMCADQGFP